MAQDPKSLKIFQLEAILKQKDTEINKLKNELNAIKPRFKVESVDEKGKPEVVRVDPVDVPVKQKRKAPMWICPNCFVECFAIHKRHHKCKEEVK